MRDGNEKQPITCETLKQNEYKDRYIPWIFDQSTSASVGTMSVTPRKNNHKYINMLLKRDNNK